MAAAGCAYHSPQFSEDVAWLPPWLQPHQLPHSRDGAGDEQLASPSACQNQAFGEENGCSGQVGRLFTKDGVKYSGCHLYFSEDDNLPAGNISSGQASHFSLHFSSIGVSQVSPGQFGEPSQIVRCQANEGSLWKAQEILEAHNERSSQYKLDVGVPESEAPSGCKSRMPRILISQPLIHGPNLNLLETEKFESEGSSKKHILNTLTAQNDTICQCIMDNGVPASEMSPVGCKRRMPNVPVSEALVKTDQKSRQRSHRKFDAGNLKTTDIDNAVELSIAASEAMVISQIVSSSFPSELLPAAAILEISLRVKQARNQCNTDISEVSSFFSNDEVDETDQLHDLDEDIMADVFRDVGLSPTHIIRAPENSSCDRKSPQQILQSDSFCDLNTHVSESHCECKDQDNVNITISLTNDFAAELQSKKLPLEHFPLQKKGSTALVPMDCINSCLGNQMMTRTDKLVQNADALNGIQMDPRDDQAIFKGNKVNPDRDTNLRKSIKEIFNGESSFISESMDGDDQCPQEQRLEAETEIVASSSTPFKDSSKCTYTQNERNIYEGTISSQDIVGSPILSLVDPLCSIVPCSISLHDDPMKETEQNAEKFIDSSAAVSLWNFNRKITMPDAKETLPLKSTDRGEESVLSKINVEGSGVPIRKQFKSLKPYSMVIPCPKKDGEVVCCKFSMDEKLTHVFSTEQNTNRLEWKKDESRLPSKFTEKCIDIDGPNNSHNLGTKDNEEVGLSIIGGRKDDNIGRSTHNNEERHSPRILNNKKRRLQACKIILNVDDEEETYKISSSPNMGKYKPENSTSQTKCRDQTIITSCDPQKSNLYTHPANKYRSLDKKVRFTELQSSVDGTSGRLQSGYGTRSKCKTTNRKDSCLHYEPEGGKLIHTSLRSCFMMHEKRMLFQGLEFLLTGFSNQKEKELEGLIRKYGGYVLSKIPSLFPDLRKRRMDTACLKFPIVLSSKKVQTSKFLYGCATNAWTLNAIWLYDSVQTGSVLPPGKYTIRPIQDSRRCLRITDPLCFSNSIFIFDRVGIMLYGKAGFITKFSKIIKHGGGQVFKSLQRLVQSLKNGKNLVGVIVVESECSISRHLRHCASENSLQTMSSSWIVNSLFSGKLLPFKKDRYAPLHRIKKPTFPREQVMDMSQEI